MAHEEVFGVCENKCFVPVAPKTKTDAVEERVTALEAGEFESITCDEFVGGVGNFNKFVVPANTTQSHLVIYSEKYTPLSYRPYYSLSSGNSQLLVTAIFEEPTIEKLNMFECPIPDTRRVTISMQSPSGGTRARLYCAMNDENILTASGTALATTTLELAYPLTDYTFTVTAAAVGGGAGDTANISFTVEDIVYYL